MGAAAALLGTATAANKGTPTLALSPDEFVTARQTGMDMSVTVLLSLKEAVTQQRDPKTQADTAENLNRWAGVAPLLFPEGTGPSKVKVKTAAKPGVWADRSGFMKAMHDYQEATASLVERAKANDAAGFKERLSRVNEACTACHSLYKERDE